VQLRFLTGAEKLEVLDTTFPHDKPQMLYWNVQSDFDGEATVEITYFTSGITWSADYVGVADKDEKQMSLAGFVRVSITRARNMKTPRCGWWSARSTWWRRSPELAQMPIARVNWEDLPSEPASSGLKIAACSKTQFMRNRADIADGGRFQDQQHEEKKIVKEGLSEYFIFSIEGTESIPDGWSKRMRSLEAGRCPVQSRLSLPAAGVWRSARQNVFVHQQQGFKARRFPLARRRRSHFP
jgi:hypothetical protein